MQTPFTSVPTLVLIEYPRYENTDRTPLVAYWLVIPIHQEGGRQFYVKGIDYWLEFILAIMSQNTDKTYNYDALKYVCG